MSDQQAAPKPGEGAGQTPDPDKFVPKDNLVKLQSEYESLKKSLDDTKLQLLDTDYLEYLEAKKTKRMTQGDVDKAKAAGLPQAAVDIIEEMKGRLVRTETVLQNVAAVLELQQIEKQHPDFDVYRADVQKLLESDKTGTITFEQAYWQAKGQDPAKASAKGDKPANSNEKPGSYLPGGNTQKTFANSYEASQDAINQVRTKYGIVGDII
jgi:hypothetical protein